VVGDQRPGGVPAHEKRQDESRARRIHAPPSVDGAYQVLTSKAPLVEAVKKGYVVTEGAMEYSKEIGLRMQYIEELMA
jgi:hypothetical protein